MISTPVNILLDTNVLFLPTEIKRQLVQATRQGRVRAYIPALVLVERERQLIQWDHVRVAKGQPIDIGRTVRQLRQWIEQLVFDLTAGLPYDDPVVAFDREQAQWVSVAWGEWLARQPADDLTTELSADEAVEKLRQRFRRKWKKRKRCLPDVDWAIHKADWSIAAVARQTGWPIVTGDQDAPFQQPGVQTIRVDEFAKQYLAGVQEQEEF